MYRMTSRFISDIRKFVRAMDTLVEEIDEFLEPEDSDDEWYGYEDRYDECGYNPYLGCYDFDC